MSATELRDPFEVIDAADERALGALGETRSARPLETWVGRGLLLLALLTVLWADLQLAKDAPNYRPDNEANRVAVVQQLAAHGTPPVLGKDFYIVDPVDTAPPRTVTLRRIDPGTSPSVAANTRYPQAFGIERPYPYYLAVPVSWIVPWNHRILALRLLCILLTCAGVAFLWRTVREAWPANPLAAGVAAITLGTMSGLVEGFAAVQPEALLFALWCAGMWLVLRDLRRRACSVASVAVWTAATCVSGVALPAALLAVGVLAWRAGAPVARRLCNAAAAVLAPTVIWVIWTLHAYGSAWPRNVPLTGAPFRPRNWRGLTSVLAPIVDVNHSIFDELYSSGIAPVRLLDERPESIVAVVVSIALVVALVSGRIAYARLALARSGALMLASFACVYLTLFVSGVVAGAPGDYAVSHFSGYAAAWAGVVGVAGTAPLIGHRRLALASVAIFTLVLVGLMLRSPIL